MWSSQGLDYKPFAGSKWRGLISSIIPEAHV
jgi:hypothetical protein